MPIHMVTCTVQVNTHEEGRELGQIGPMTHQTVFTAAHHGRNLIESCSEVLEQITHDIVKLQESGEPQSGTGEPIDVTLFPRKSDA